MKEISRQNVQNKFALHKLLLISTINFDVKLQDSVGDAKCEICPAHSQALFAGSVECRCNDNFYRAGGDPKSYGCTRPPSAPRNLHFRFVNSIFIKSLHVNHVGIFVTRMAIDLCY